MKKQKASSYRKASVIKDYYVLIPLYFKVLTNPQDRTTLN